MTCLVVVPMLGRPHTVQPLMKSLEGTKDARVLFVCSPGDKGTQDACRKAGDLLVVGWEPGPADFQKKVHAAYRNSDEPLLFLGACDLKFHPGWLDNARKHLKPGIGVVGTQDMGNPRVLAGFHATHSLVTREYADLGTIDGPGILHEGYDHSFCDDELIATAIYRNAFAFARDSVVEHLHPSWSKAPMDDVYRKGRAEFTADRLLFQARRHLWT